LRFQTTYKFKIISVLFASFLLGGCVDENGLTTNGQGEDITVGVVIPEPAPTEPTPTEPAPTEPAPTEPAPTEPAPTEPAPTEPAPTEPPPTEPAPTEPAPTEPAPTEPAPTEPAPTEPAPTTGAATLNWMPPTENTDGSTLTDLVEYKIYYGTSPDAMTNEITNISTGLSTYVIENLQSNTTYYFSMTAINADGIESSFSNIVSKNITG
jgi:outer membrane biosynthesis protein TonB